MEPLGRQPIAFTTSYNGRSNILANKVSVAEAFNPESQPEPPTSKEFTAIWDTGATNSAVTQTVIDQCLLKPTGITEVHTASGNYRTETYLVSIFLPSRVVVPSVKVTKGMLTSGFDVLIGMDVIGQGDFAVTHKDNKTVFSFRMPSIECIDFVKHPQYRTPMSSSKVDRNAPCPCGSGKKYKKCCGKQTQNP
jgi:hypothetical protein